MAAEKLLNNAIKAYCHGIKKKKSIGNIPNYLFLGTWSAEAADLSHKVIQFYQPGRFKVQRPATGVSRMDLIIIGVHH